MYRLCCWGTQTSRGKHCQTHDFTNAWTLFLVVLCSSSTMRLHVTLLMLENGCVFVYFCLVTLDVHTLGTAAGPSAEIVPRAYTQTGRGWH